MNLYQENKIINLNSEYAKSYFNGDKLSHVQFQTLGLLIPDPNIVYCNISIRSAQFPVSYLIVNENNNVLNYTIDSSSYLITIPEGNYDVYDLINQMKTQFSNNGHTFSITFNINNGLLTFSHLTLPFSFLANSTLKEIIGFSSAISSVSNIMTLPYPLNLLGTLKLKIISKNLITDNYDSGIADLLEVIPVNTGPFNLITFDNYNHINLLKTTKIDNIDFQILDSFNRFIDFNNQNWSITLSLSIFRRFLPTIEDIIKKI